MNTFHRLLAGGIAALALTGAAAAAPVDVVTQAQIEAATTPAQHEAIARTYEEQATAAEARAEGHAKMADAYRYYGKGPRPKMAGHCERLAKAYRTAATEYRMLAQEHREMAAAAAK